MPSLSSIQAQLNRFYLQALAEAAFTPEHHQQLSMPLLMAVSPAYLDAPVRVMFIGKESNGWHHQLSAYYALENDAAKTLRIEALQASYRRVKNQSTRHGPFMRMLDRIAHALAGGASDAIAWTNLMKMDWQQSGRQRFSRTSLHHSAALQAFSAQVLQFEVQLLQPDIIIFGTGWRYDTAIRATFPPPQLQTVQVHTPRALWEFTLGHARCFRLQHPQAINRPGRALAPVGTYYQHAMELALRHLSAQATHSQNS